MTSLPNVCTTIAQKFSGVVISFKNYISRDQQIPHSRNDNLRFIVSSLIGFLQIKSQDPPYKTHPKTWNVAVAMLLLYGLAFDAEQRFSSTNPSFASAARPAEQRFSSTNPSFASAARRFMGLFGSVLVASLASMLFPGWVGPILYVVYPLFYHADALFDLVQSKFVDKTEETDTNLV